MSISSQMNCVTLDTEQTYVKYRSKQTVCFVNANFVQKRVTESMGRFLINCAFHTICSPQILLCCVV